MIKVNNLKSAFISFCISFLIVSCSATPEATQVAKTTLAPVVYLSFGEVEKRILYEEQIGQNNCNGNEIVSSSVNRERSIMYALEMSGEITVDATGKIGGDPIGEIGLGVEVARKFGVLYGQEERLSRSMTVSAGAGTNMLHMIQQFEIWETGEATIKSGENTIKVPFKFRRDFGIDLITSDNMGCPTRTPATIEEAKVLTNTPYPTYTPLPTYTPYPKPTGTPIPTSPTVTPSPTPDPRLQVGETWKENDVWITLSDVNFLSDGEIYLTVVIKNKTGGDISFSWHEDNLKMTDNLGNKYYAIHNGGSTPKGQAVLAAEQEYTLACWNCKTLRYENSDNAWFQQAVTEIIFSVSEISRISKVTWIIAVPH